MSPVALIWIALLHAFSFATASSAVRRGDAGGSVVAVQERHPARWIGATADVPVPDIRVPLRIPLRAARADAQRSATPAPHGKDGSALPLDHRFHPLAVSLVRQPREMRAPETQRLDSRRTLLLYFPTAPPRRA